MLKTDLHIHTSEDPEDNIKHSAEELIDQAASKGFEVISITNHNGMFFNDKIREYAEKRGILLIPGVEIDIEGKEVLVYDPFFKHKEEIMGVRSFEDLRELKKKSDIFVVAPHPYFIKPDCVKNLLIKHIDVFDAVEYSHFYLKTVNWNRKGKKVADKYSKPMIGTSDTHFMWQLGYTYSLVDAEKDPMSVVQAIKNGEVEIISKPLPLLRFLQVGFWVFKGIFERKPRK